MSRGLEIVLLQHKLNTKIHPSWFTQGFAWERAILSEVSELQDQIGWKWWKKQQLDLPQAQLEVVDILHFVVSKGIEMELGPHRFEVTSLEEAAISIVRELDHVLDKLDELDKGIVIQERVLSLSEEMLRQVTSRDDTPCPASQSALLSAFASLAASVNLSGQDVYRIYLAKNILNEFRQERGYATGGYKKMWMFEGVEQEDNAVLETLMLRFAHLNAADLLEELSHVYAQKDLT